MASTRATNALKSYVAQSVARNETVTFDKIIFAHISGLNDATLANINNMPTVDQIKHTANIQQTGYIADDQVVYSVTLGSEIGDFTFNFVGLVNSAKNVLGVAIYTGDIVKTRTKAEEQGNALTRNIILQVNNAKTLTNIQTQAKAWQFDFTDKFLQMKPKKITAATTNAADSSGHTHEIEKASTTQSGIVQLVDDWTTHDNRKALTASTGKRLYDTLKGLIDSLSGRTTTAQNAAANALSKTTPKKITASTTNVADQNGHTHEIEKASTSIAGVVKLNDSLTSNATDEALTARQGKVLSEKVDQAVRGLEGAKTDISVQVTQGIQSMRAEITSLFEWYEGRLTVNEHLSSRSEDDYVDNSTFDFRINIPAKPYRRRFLLGGEGQIIEANNVFNLELDGSTLERYSRRNSANYQRAQKYLNVCLVRI